MVAGYGHGYGRGTFGRHHVSLSLDLGQRVGTALKAGVLRGRRDERRRMVELSFGGDGCFHSGTFQSDCDWGTAT